MDCTRPVGNKQDTRQCIRPYIHIHVLMRDEKEERSKQGQTNNKETATQHTQGSELPRVGLETTTVYTLDRALYH